MSRYSDQIRDEYGRTVPKVSIYVYKWDAYAQVAGDLETLTDDLSAALGNPLTSDADGLYYFNSADGQKLLEYHYGGKVQERSLILVGALPVPQAAFGGLFINAAALTIPVGMDLICTTGYSVLDVGSAIYTYDVAVNSAYVTAHPLSSFISLNNRGFRLSTEQDITPQMFGWVAGDAGPAIQTAFGDGNKTVRASIYDNYTIASTVVVPQGGTLLIENGAVFSPGANIAMFDLTAPDAICQSIGSPGTIQGNGATYPTARAFLVSGGYDQQVINTNILDMGGACVEFAGADSGQRFRGDGGLWLRHDPTQPSITKTGAIDVAAGNRTFTDVRAVGGCLINLEGMANTGIINCEFVSLIFGPNASRTRVSGDRIAILSGTLTVDGYDNCIMADVIAGNVELAATSQRCIVGPLNLLAGGTITDLSTATGDNMNYVYDSNGLSFTPVWAQTAGTGPTLGNGTLSGRLYRNGRQQTARISGSIGSTTNKGDSGGDWTWTLPAPYNRAAKFAAIGTASAIDTGGSVFRNGVARIAQGGTAISVRNNSSTGWKGTVPHTWATGDSFDISIIYEVG